MFSLRTALGRTAAQRPQPPGENRLRLVHELSSVEEAAGEERGRWVAARRLAERSRAAGRAVQRQTSQNRRHGGGKKRHEKQKQYREKTGARIVSSSLLWLVDSTRLSKNKFIKISRSLFFARSPPPVLQPRLLHEKGQERAVPDH